jgi:cobalt-zinc-cadmium efflux system membrane fusion protein
MKAITMIAVLVAAQLAGAEDVVQLDGAQLDRAGIEVRPVAMEEFGNLVPVVGQLVRAPGSTLTLKTVVGGRVESLDTAPGERVSRGQVLFSLHSHELLAMQGELLRASERLKLAEKRVEAGRELLAIEGISRLDLEVREQEAFVARLDYETRREELLDHGLPADALEKALETRTPDAHLPVFSPIDGVVLDLFVQEHEWVQEFAPLVVVGDPQRIELELQIAPDQASSVAAGDIIEFAPVVRPDALGTATVITQVPQVDPESRTVRVRARIDKGSPGSFPGAFVQGTLVHGAARRSLAVPDSAVITVDGRDAVFVRTGEGQFAMRPVTTGLQTQGRREVVEGLAVGEEVATSGVFLLKSALVRGAEGGE